METQLVGNPVPLISRRNAIVLSASGVAAALAARSRITTLAQTDPATFVLVHGAWAGGWIWRDVITQLREAGHTVYATTATGLGDRVHLATPAIDLNVHIADVVKVLEFEDLRQVTLVGWGYGGMIITGVADRIPDRLAQLVYLDAFLPTDGESAWDVARNAGEARTADFPSGLDAGESGYFTVDPYRARIVQMVPDVGAQAWLFANLVPQSRRSHSQPIQLGLKDLTQNPASAAIPRAFIFCTEGKGNADLEHTARTFARVRADPGWTVIELTETHFAPVNQPTATANALLSLV